MTVIPKGNRNDGQENWSMVGRFLQMSGGVQLGKRMHYYDHAR